MTMNSDEDPGSGGRLDGRCPGQNCENDAGEPGPCPFKYEINDDRTPCRCCDECRQECAWDV